MAKSKGKIKAQAQWHVDFRIIDTLPDTKLIRTDFMLTFVAICLAVGLLFLLAYKEYKSITLSREIAELKNNIKQDTAGNRQHLSLDGQFKSLSNKVTELDTFRYNPYPAPDFLLALSEIRSDEIVLSNVVFREVNRREGRTITQLSNVSLSGTIAGSSELATQIVSDFVDKLKSLELLSEYINRIQLDSLNRLEKSGSFEFSISIELNPVKS